MQGTGEQRIRPLVRLRAIALIFYAFGMVVTAAGFLRFESNMEDVFQWLPDETPDRDLYNDFVQRFGTDDFLVVTWPGCTVSDSRCDALADQLQSQDDRDLLKEVMSGRELLRQLVRDHGQKARSVVQRFQGTYFGPDHRETCVVVGLTERGMDARRETVAFVERVASEAIQVPKDQLILAGYPQVGAYGDEVVRQSIANMVGPSCLISTLVAWICLRNAGLTVIILAISGLAAGLSISVVTLSGAKWGGLSSVIPTLAYILSVSGGMHLVNYARTPGTDRLYFRMLRIGWRPCLLSSLTTAAGILSLCRSDFPAIREFGVFCACGILASLVCQLLLMPVAIDWWNPKHLRPIDQNTRTWLLDRVLPWSGPVVGCFVLVTLGASWGLTSLRSDLEVERNFRRSAPVMQNIARFEKKIGPVDQTELLIQFKDVKADGFEQRLDSVRRIEQDLIASGLVSNTLSAAAWFPEMPEGKGLRKAFQRTAYRRAIRLAREDLTSSSYLDASDDQERWRVSIRFPFLEATDFSQLHTRLPELAKASVLESNPDAQVDVAHTGVSLLYHIAQRDLVADLYRNFAFAFVMICPLMMLVLKSWTQGLIAMIPNLCPALLVYGWLGWADFPIDIGMAMAACVALGIAVDDTTHFLLRFQDLKRNPSTASASLKIAYGQCSRAMLATTLITGLGLAAFLPGPLAAMTRFAGLLIVLVAVALLCDLVLLPSLLKTCRFTSEEIGARAGDQLKHSAMTPD